MSYYGIDGTAAKHFNLDLQTCVQQLALLRKGHRQTLNLGEDAGMTLDQTIRVGGEVTEIRIVVTQNGRQQPYAAVRVIAPRGTYWSLSAGNIPSPATWEGNYASPLAAFYGLWAKKFTDYEARYAVKFAD